MLLLLLKLYGGRHADQGPCMASGIAVHDMSVIEGQCQSSSSRQGRKGLLIMRSVRVHGCTIHAALPRSTCGALYGTRQQGLHEAGQGCSTAQAGTVQCLPESRQGLVGWLVRCDMKVCKLELDFQDSPCYPCLVPLMHPTGHWGKDAARRMNEMDDQSRLRKSCRCQQQRRTAAG